MAKWFQRIKKGIETSTSEKKEPPDGLWTKCPKCKKLILTKDLRENNFVCDKCNYHFRINSAEYFQILFDEDQSHELFGNIYPVDILGFKDIKTYEERLQEAQKKTGLADAIRVGVGKVNGFDLVVACMDFDFIGGSMGSVVGEKIARSVDYCVAHHVPLLIIS
ncbi:MAG: acetyl-CoA carboxylase carboxyl transferase subunit beta, partial [Thermoflavifilum sp.]|nr:acetyl-CoA carboxylase carboxyl transferase subunit beta [Thermoflavifilum sp.]